MNNQATEARRIGIMGHRGAREIAPENTLAAYQLALECGVDAIELDVHLTKDGELAVIHDARLERTTDGRGEIRDCVLAELQVLNAAAKHAGETDFGVQRIPTLQDVYALVQGTVKINIEIKTDANGQRYPGIEHKVVDRIQSNGASAYTVISSFDFSTLVELRELAPDLALYAIVSKEYFQSKGTQEPNVLVSDLVNHGFDWVAVNKAFVSSTMVELLHRHNILVHTWVINEVPEMWSQVEMGVDFITTDRPDILMPAYRAGKSLA